MFTDDEIEHLFQTEDRLGLVALSVSEDLTLELMERLLETKYESILIALINPVVVYKNNISMTTEQLEDAGKNPSEVVRVLSCMKLLSQGNYKGWPKEWLETKFNITLDEEFELS